MKVKDMFEIMKHYMAEGLENSEVYIGNEFGGIDVPGGIDTCYLSVNNTTWHHDNIKEFEEEYDDDEPIEDVMKRIKHKEIVVIGI